MKNLCTIMAFCFASLVANATQRTVNNNNNLPGNPGQFTDIQLAINGSNPGDTILVAGSPTTYATTALNISKKIILLGPGYNPAKQNPLTATISSGVNISAGTASGTVIMGFILAQGVTFSSGANVNNITIRRCMINYSIVFLDSTSNVLIAENSITAGYVYMETAKNQYKLEFTNNIFSQSSYNPFYFQYTTASNTPPITITHNLFINGSSSKQLISSGWNNWISISVPFVYNLVVENNIFYNVSPVPAGSGLLSGCTFDNNITYSGGTLPTIPVTLNGNTGAGNLDNTDPQFVNALSTTSTINYTLDNLRLKPGSPALAPAATDHTDIGPTGGSYPIYVSTNQYLTGEPTIPEVKSANFLGAGSVTPGGSLQIQVKAQTIN